MQLKPRAKDEADEAWEQEQAILQEAKWRATRPSRFQPRGRCYNCGETCSGLFCDVSCRQDYEHEQRTRQNQQAQQRGENEHGC